MNQTSQGQPSASMPPTSRKPPVLVREETTPDQPTRPTGGIEDLMRANQPTRPTNAPTPGSPQFQQEYMTRLVWKNAVLGNLNAMAMVLSVRLTLLASVAGGIWLSYLAVAHPDQSTLIAQAIYCVGVVLPCVVLAIRGR